MPGSMRRFHVLRFYPGCEPVSGLLSFLLAVALMVSGCSVGPDYKRPEVETPADWRWKQASPRDEESKGPWWEAFGDSELNRLQERAFAANQDLKAAAARVQQARARARVTASEFYPNITANPSWQRYRTSSSVASSFPMESITANDFRLPIDLSYEVDLWGRVRRSFESSRNEMLASAADFQNVLFTLQADLATTYFRLRSLDREIEVLNEAVTIREHNRSTFEAREKAGYSSQLDVSRAQTDLSVASSSLADTKRRRAEMEHALAILCGASPSQLEIAPRPTTLEPPEVRPGIPSELLERRPDIAQAERRLASRNAQIGVAYAAFFPTIRLTGSAGYQSAELSDLFNWGSRVWSMGPSVSIPISAFGLNHSKLKQTRAAYDEAVAQYHQTILVAFREVDDSLAALRFLKEQSMALNEARIAAKKTSELALIRYNQGLLDYLGVIDAERSRLDSDLQFVRVNVERTISTIRLIKAIGGGWSGEGAKS